MEKFKVKKKILIIGGTSLLGINLAVSTLNIYDIYITLHKKKIKIKNTKNIKINFEKYKEAQEIIKNINPEYILNFAALTDVNKCEINKKLAYYLNATIPYILSKISNNLKCKLIHISTDQLFNKKKILFNEQSKVSPLNYYAKTKYLGERKIIKFCKNYLILRTNFFGYGTQYKKSYSDFILNELEKRKEIYLSDSIFFNPIYIGNLIKIINFMILNNVKGLFNISADNNISKYLFAITLCNHLNINNKRVLKIKNNIIVKQIAFRPLNMSLANKKLKKIYINKIGTVEENIQMMINDLSHKNLLKKYINK